MKQMPDICLGFEVHQPYRIAGSFDGGRARRKKLSELHDIYLDTTLDRMVLKRVCRKCYQPANEIIFENIERFRGQDREFKVVYSLSGVLVEQLKSWAPETLKSFSKLVDTGCVELLDQTYYHSLSSLYTEGREEFKDQVRAHRELMEETFGVVPRVFENTEFIYHNSIGRVLGSMGYRGVFTEGAERVLGWRSPNHVYRARDSEVAVLLRNFRLSDDIAFRFSAVDWPGWPLTADKYASWIASAWGDLVTVFIDYETFGEHQWPETGILDFLKWLPGSLLDHGNVRFVTASEAIESHSPVGLIDIGDFDATSWADVERTTNAWLGNDMQRTCYRALRDLEPFVRASGDEDIIRLWRCLQISDHLYYMYTQPGASGLVHGYFSSQPPVKAFWTFSAILSDLYLRTSRKLARPAKDSCRFLRIIPPDSAFHFHINRNYIQLSAHSLKELGEAISMAPLGSLEYHAGRGDFEKWVRLTVGDVALADGIRGTGGDDIRGEMLGCLNERVGELESWNRGS